MPTPKRKPKPRKPKAQILPPAKTQEKRGRGRPPFEASPEERKLVEAASVFLTHEHIAKLLRDGISETTLRLHFPRELELGSIKANVSVGQSLFKKATGNGPQSVAAAIFWTKVRMGWKETDVLELRGKVTTVTSGMTAREAAEAYGNTRRRRKA